MVNLQKPASQWTLSDSSCHSSYQISLSTYSIPTHFLSRWCEGYWVGFSGFISHRPSCSSLTNRKEKPFLMLKVEMHLRGIRGEEVGLPSSSLLLTEGLMCSDVAGRPVWIRDEERRAQTTPCDWRGIVSESKNMLQPNYIYRLFSLYMPFTYVTLKVLASGPDQTMCPLTLFSLFLSLSLPGFHLYIKAVTHQAGGRLSANAGTT